MENDVYNLKKEDTSKKKRIEVSYYEARFTQKCGAILLDCVLFVILLYLRQFCHTFFIFNIV